MIFILFKNGNIPTVVGDLGASGIRPVKHLTLCGSPAGTFKYLGITQAPQ